MKVIKRDSRIVNFDKQKIIDAITKAFEEVDGVLLEESKFQVDYIANIIESKSKTLDVEEIQNIVEEQLMNSNRKDVAREYIRYRYDREKERKRKSSLIQEIRKKVLAKDVLNQNANVDEKSFGGRTGEATDALMKDYALNYCMSEMARDNHINNEIYTHDLNSYAVGMHNCLTIPFDDLLANGFSTRQVDIRPASSINSAFQLVAVIFQLQSLMQFGGVSASHIDHTMIPYIRKSFYKHYVDGMKYIGKFNDYEIKWQKENDMSFNPIDISIDDKTKYKYEEEYIYAMDMTEKELNQAVEALFHNLNSLQSRSGNQLPFSSINYGTATNTEGRMVIKALIQGTINGVGKLHSTSIFPCCIFQCAKGINRELGDVNYDLFQLALKSTSQRLYPNYANVDWSGNEGYNVNNPKTIFSTMGCRTANGYDINAEKDQNPQLKDGRGNICPVTIILPTIAMESLKEWNDEVEPQYEIDITKDMDLVDYFLKRLEIKIEEAKDQLIERFEWICSQSSDSAKFMYENNIMYGYKKEEGIRSALKHGTLAIGQLGIAECLQILIGCDHTTEYGMNIAKRIEQLFKDKCLEYKNEYKLNFGVYFTPAENLCYTSMQKFKDKYGEIPNISDKDFFTNSMHIPVWKEMSPLDKIDLESQLTGYSSAGCITYVELDSSVRDNLGALETLVNYAMDKDIPYFAINVPNDMCNNCGYIGDIPNECPICNNSNIKRLRRVTGLSRFRLRNAPKLS